MAGVRLTEDPTPFVHTTLRARKWDLYNTNSVQIEASNKRIGGFPAILANKRSGLSRSPNLPVSAHLRM